MKDKMGMLVALLIVAAGVVFVKMSGPLPQPLAKSHTTIIEASVDGAEKVESESIGEISSASTVDLDDMVLIPDESSLTYQEKLANAKKAMQNL